MEISSSVGLPGRFFRFLRELPWRVARFVQEVRQEVGRVTWPSRKETGYTTLMVFAMVIAAAIFFFLVDLALGHGVRWVLNLGTGG